MSGPPLPALLLKAQVCGLPATLSGAQSEFRPPHEPAPHRSTRTWPMVVPPTLQSWTEMHRPVSRSRICVSVAVGSVSKRCNGSVYTPPASQLDHAGVATAAAAVRLSA